MGLRAGFWRVDVTPPVGVRLGGYAHRLGRSSKKVYDSLYANLVYLEVGGVEVLIVNLDVFGVSRDFVDGVKYDVSKDAGLEGDNILVLATHTYSSHETVMRLWPNTYPYGESELEVLGKWMVKVRKVIASASLKAIEKALKSSVRIGCAKTFNLTSNSMRRDGCVDEELSFMYFDNDRSRFMLINYACQPSCNIDLGISADYPGVVYSVLNGYDVKCLFTIGAAGNIIPRGIGRSYMDVMGRDIALTTLSELRGKSTIIDCKEMIIHKENLKLNFRIPPNIVKAREKYRQMYMECINKIEEEEYMWKLFYADEEYEVSKENILEYDVEIKVLKLNDKVLFVSIPGGLSVEYGLKLKNYAWNKGFRCIMPFNYSEDYIGYIPHEGTYDEKITRWNKMTLNSAKKIFSKIIELTSI